MSDSKAIEIPIKPGLFTCEDFRAPQATLRGTRCRRCSETLFPARNVCPRCRSAQTMTEVELSRRGTVYSFTRVTRVPAHYTEPYVLGLIDLPEGVRLLSQIASSPPDALRIGIPVQLVIGPLFETPEGQRVWGYRFESVLSSSPE